MAFIQSMEACSIGRILSFFIHLFLHLIVMELSFTGPVSTVVFAAGFWRAHIEVYASHKAFFVAIVERAKYGKPIVVTHFVVLNFDFDFMSRTLLFVFRERGGEFSNAPVTEAAFVPICSFAVFFTEGAGCREEKEKKVSHATILAWWLLQMNYFALSLTKREI